MMEIVSTMAIHSVKPYSNSIPIHLADARQKKLMIGRLNESQIRVLQQEHSSGSLSICQNQSAGHSVHHIPSRVYPRLKQLLP